MKTAILAGGRGTRLSEKTGEVPKPMIEIGGEPILWHVMRHYAHYDLKEFIIALGYKGEIIKKYFSDYFLLKSDFSVNLGNGEISLHAGARPDWVIHLIDTGQSTMTGGRIKRLGPHIGNETFMLTWADGVSDVDLRELLDFHRAHGKLATVTSVRPPARFGCLDLDGDCVVRFEEKPNHGDGWINGAFFVLEPEVFDYIDGDQTMWEREPLERLAAERQLMAYRHDRFWQCMDTLKDQHFLQDLWETGKAPWRVWE